MDGMLSQDEINALLNGMDLSADEEPDKIGSSEEVTEVPSSTPSETGDEQGASTEALLTDVEKDAIGEVANISMGSSATTLYSLVNRKVNITTPVVQIATWDNLLEEYERPCVFIQIKYTEGLDGTNILVLKEHDVKVITDLMMGSAATSLSTMLKTKIDISPPESSLFDLTKVQSGEEIAPFLGGKFVKISFRMQIDDLVDSSIMQLYPVEFAKKVVQTFIGTQMGGDVGSSESTEAAAPKQEQPAQPAQGAGQQPTGMPMQDMSQMGMQQGMNPQMGMPMQGMYPQMGMPMQGMYPQMGMPMQGMYPQMGMQQGMNPQMMGTNQQNVNVQPAQFQSFSENTQKIPGQENIGLIMDVPLEVTVELGRTTKSISEILDFTPGTIIELDRIAGEPIDVLVNGKFVAKGEVVVIEESFSVRITEIIK